MNRHLYRVETNRITVLLHTKLQCLGDCNGVGEGLGSTEKKPMSQILLRNTHDYLTYIHILFMNCKVE